MINARERAGFKTGLQFYVGRSASDHQFVRDPAYIHLEIEALHRRAREMQFGRWQWPSIHRDDAAFRAVNPVTAFVLQA